MKKLILIILFLAASVNSAYAQLLIEKSRVEETVKPGDTLADTIRLHNNGAEPITLTIYWEDFEYQPPFDGKKKFMPAGSSQYSLSNWISFSPQEIIIPPKGVRDVNFTIKVPPSAAGGYYGVLFFESGSRRDMDTTGVSIVTRTGALFFIEAANKDKKSSIKSVEFKDDTLVGIFENKGNVILFPKGIYYIMEKEGLVVEREELSKIYLPPANEAPFSIALSNSLKAGEYTLVLTFDLKDGDSVVKEVDFVKSDGGSYKTLQQRD